VVAAVAANVSLMFVAQATNLANAFSVTLLGQGVTPAGGTAVMRPALARPHKTLVRSRIRDGWSHA
jgi:hypothetical protein